LDRGSKYYKEIVRTINAFNKQMDNLTASLKKEKKVNAILFDESIEKAVKYSRVSDIYGKAGTVSQAVKYLELAIKDEVQTTVDKTHFKSDHQHHSQYVSLAEMYLKQYRFYEAKEILDRVRREGSAHANKEKNLTDFCKEKITVWESREKRMNALLKKAEAEYGSFLESGVFYFKIKDYERAEKAYLGAIQSKEAEVEAYYGLAHTYLAMDEAEKAVEVFEKAIELDPDNPLLYRDMGLIAFQNNNLEPAELFFAKAIELAPAEAELYKPLANLYINLGQRDKAIALYENALRTNEDNPVIQHDLAMIYNDTIADAEAG
jgi:tetratricopeptide (TPR) repeat protein